MAHIFISYKHDDSDFPELLRSRLEKEGFTTWMDTDIKTGDRWSASIDKAIADSFAVVVIMTPEARASEFITYEWSFALGLNKFVLPIVFRTTDLHPKLSELQTLNFTNKNIRPWDQLAQHLKEAEKATEEDDQKSDQTGQGATSNPIVVKLLNDFNSGHASTRLGVVKTLGQFNDDAAIDGLLKALLNNDRGVREAASIALGEKRRDDIPYALLVRLHGDKVKNVRVAAANSLGHIATPEAIVGLIEAVVNEGDYEVREACIDNLELLAWSTGDDRYVPSLTKLLLDCGEYIEEHNNLKESQSSLKEEGLASAMNSVSIGLQLIAVAKEIDLCEKIASILLEIGTQEALAAVEEWRRKQRNQ